MRAGPTRPGWGRPSATGSTPTLGRCKRPRTPCAGRRRLVPRRCAWSAPARPGRHSACGKACSARSSPRADMLRVVDDNAMTPPSGGRPPEVAGAARRLGGSRGRSASGARLAGDDYQHLVAWCWTLRALLPGRAIAAIEVEAPDAGNVDDVVLEHQ